MDNSMSIFFGINGTAIFCVLFLPFHMEWILRYFGKLWNSQILTITQPAAPYSSMVQLFESGPFKIHYGQSRTNLQTVCIYNAGCSCWGILLGHYKSLFELWPMSNVSHNTPWIFNTPDPQLWYWYTSWRVRPLSCHTQMTWIMGVERGRILQQVWPGL